jgi:ferredoxin
MKVQVDLDLCESNGLCEALAPETFELGDDDALRILDDRVSDDNVDTIERAVASCPRSAISIAD